MLVDLVSALVRAASFIALFQAAGGAIFIAVFAAHLRGSDPFIRLLGTRCAWAGIALVSAHYVLEAARMSGELAGVLDAQLHRLVFDSSLRTAWLLRLIGLAVIAMALPRRDRAGTLASLVGVVLCTLGFAMVGHTAAASAPAWLAVLLLAHVLAVAFWFGALWPLYTASRRESPQHTAMLVEAFSRLATWLVPALFVAGALMTWALLGRWSALLEPYGLLLLAKVGGFALLMGLASLNKWRYGPTLEREPRAQIWFQRTVVSEYVIICGVLLATAVLTTFYSPGE